VPNPVAVLGVALVVLAGVGAERAGARTHPADEPVAEELPASVCS
jgi:hypothetical protein